MIVLISVPFEICPRLLLHREALFCHLLQLQTSTGSEKEKGKPEALSSPWINYHRTRETFDFINLLIYFYMYFFGGNTFNYFIIATLLKHKAAAENKPWSEEC